MEIVNENTAAVTPKPQYPLIIKAFALLFSILFHPLFIPLIAFSFLVYVLPGYFLGISSDRKLKLLMSVTLNTVFFPLITVLLLKGLGFIRSVLLRDKKERIIPYVASNIFYFWIFLVFKNQEDVPGIATSLMFAVFLASSFGLVINSFYKISMHALALGTFAGLLLVIALSEPTTAVFAPLVFVFLISGIVSTSRLILSDHTPFDIYSGLLIGILCSMVSGFIFI